MNYGLQAAQSFFLTLLMMPVVAVAIYFIVRMVIDQALDLIVAIVAVVLLLVGCSISISSANQVVGLAFIVALLTLMVMFPFAESQLEAMEMRVMDIEALDKAHRAVMLKPDNVAGYFQLAKCLYGFGLHGHAISLAEATFAKLSTNVDNVKNRSMADLFHGEAYLLKKWKREADPKSFRPIACPHCGFMNPVGEIACGGCGQAYLMGLASKLDVRHRFTGKLVLASAAVAALIVLVARVSQAMNGNGMMIPIAIGVGILGSMIYLLFKPKTIL